MSTNFKLISETEYNEINRKLDSILQHVSNPNQTAEPSLGQWITEKQAQDITGKKTTTLWKMRNKGLLTFTKINNKIFYDKESILQLMDDNRKDAFQQE